MSYDQNSFLQGIAVGKSLRGWSSGYGTATPKCWNDEGVYDYFYIDYLIPLSGLTLAMFHLSTRIMCNIGELEATDIEAVDSSTYKIYCPISKATNGWIAVTGYNSSWVKYDSGLSVPEYSSIFWLDGKSTYTPGFLDDEGEIPRIGQESDETFSHYYSAMHNFNYADAGTMPYVDDPVGSDTVSVKYS